jgi:hypothetical protein
MITRQKSPTYFEVYTNPRFWSEDLPFAGQPGRKYESSEEFRHRDSLGRVFKGPEDDRYLSATDGRLEPLIVQATEDIWDGPSNSTWTRSMVQECTPTILRVVYVLLGSHIQNDRKIPRSILHWLSMLVGWIPACLIIAVLVRLTNSLENDLSDRV